MTLAHVMLICTAGIAACAALVFTVETLVAFCFHDESCEDAAVVRIEPTHADPLRVAPLRIDPARVDPVLVKIAVDRAA